MTHTAQLPFQSFTFWIIEGRQPRAYMRLSAPVEGEALDEGGAEAEAPRAADVFYTLELMRGSAANPLTTITREVPVAQAVNLRDALQRLGVFSWEESYGDTSAPGTRRWSLSLVFEEGVFAIEAKGGSDVPPHFAEMLEELYRLDFPRPAVPQGGAGAAVRAGAGIGLGAGMGSDVGDWRQLFADAQRNPQAFQAQMKEVFSTMPPAEQNQLLDLLAATGMATREWWERFLRD